MTAPAPPEPPLPPERPAPTEPPEPSEPRRAGLRPGDRRVVQALALAALLPALLSIQWLDETHIVQRNLEPREKATTVPHGGTGELAGAQWRIEGRQTRAPYVSTQAPGGGSADVTELRLTLAVLPRDAEAAKAVGSYGITYRLSDGDGHEWSAVGLRTGSATGLTSDAKPRPGAVTRITVTGTVPRSKAGSLRLEVRPPRAQRPTGPLPLLRFAP
ncbi:hypothetical protein [Actinomadura fibrosa]|uniref:Uncharacterized protein n=1 Tax=Actinomadura fibrosa TaxID=111802 RepID=A0ABW2Y0I8_9ACTN|nr:hypothetical protein [Actinomadura fibrosa]